MKFGYISGSMQETSKYETIIDAFHRNKTQSPDQVICIHRGLDGSRVTLSNQELEEKARKLAMFLVSKGIRKGDRIALYGPNTLEWVIGEFGIIMAGAVAVHVAISIKDARDIREVLDAAECKGFIMDPGRRGENWSTITPILEILKMEDENKPKDSDKHLVVFLRNNDLKKYDNLDNIIQKANLNVKLPTIYPEDTALIFTTSGTTGLPKMVKHAHFDITNSGSKWNGSNQNKNNITYNDRPFGWIAGSPVVFVLQGGTRVFTDASLAVRGENTEFIWNILKTEKCNSAVLLPYFLSDLIDLKDDIVDDGYRLFSISTGGQIVDNYYTQVIGRFCDQLQVMYGSTEAGWIATKSPVKQGEFLEMGDVGKPGSGVEIRVVDQSDIPLYTETTGNIQVRSRFLFRGYFGNQKLSEDAFTKDGWFKTGDLGKISETGSLIVEGRTKEIISRGTRKILPGLVEDLIQQMDHIKHVAVIPVPDKRLFEEVCVCFVPGEHHNIREKDVKEFCKTNMFQEKAVDGIGDMPTYFLKFDDFPMLMTGKPNKIKLRLDAMQKLNIKQ